ncbi:MAG: lytic transglycosylase domain-containing protein [Deferrisomatales bacterium]
MALRPVDRSPPLPDPAEPRARARGSAFSEVLSRVLAERRADPRALQATVELARIEALRAAVTPEAGGVPPRTSLLRAILGALGRGIGLRQPVAPPPEPAGGNRDAVRRVVVRAARHYGLDPELVLAVIEAESGFDAGAVSPAGAQGLMQLMPATARELGVADPFDPEQNVWGGARYLRELLDRYEGDLDTALAAYNWGLGNLGRRPGEVPAETRQYVARVRAAYRRAAG